MIERDWDGEKRGQNVPDLGPVPFLRRLDKRLLILREQLLALLCILGLAGRLGLRDTCSGTSRGQTIQGVR